MSKFRGVGLVVHLELLQLLREVGGRDAPRGQRHDGMIEEPTAVHEERAQHCEKSTDLRVPHHYLQLSLILAGAPILLDVLETLSDLPGVSDKRAVLSYSHKAEAHGSDEFELDRWIRLLEEGVQAAGYEQEADEPVAAGHSRGAQQTQWERRVGS